MTNPSSLAVSPSKGRANASRQPALRQAQGERGEAGAGAGVGDFQQFRSFAIARRPTLSILPIGRRGRASRMVKRLGDL
jgi:hypothetical protein